MGLGTAGSDRRTPASFRKVHRAQIHPCAPTADAPPPSQPSPSPQAPPPLFAPPAAAAVAPVAPKLTASSSFSSSSAVKSMTSAATFGPALPLALAGSLPFRALSAAACDDATPSLAPAAGCSRVA